MDSNLTLGLLERLESLGLHERVDEARAIFAESFGRKPEGILLVDGSGCVAGLDAGASEILKIDPRRVLGVNARELLASSESDFILSWRLDPEGEVAGLFTGTSAVTAVIDAIEVETLGLWQEMFEQESLEELVEWFVGWAADQTSGGSGAVALRDGEWLHLWGSWPKGEAPQLPIRFLGRESRAYKIGKVCGDGLDPICLAEGGVVVPIIVDGSVIALVAMDQYYELVVEAVNQFGAALRQFIESD